MTNKLYIIGNGFDLHHNLKTSYYDFAEYLKKNNNVIYDILESYVSYPTSDEDLWSCFEENLAHLNAEEILSEHSDRLPDISSEEFRDRDMHVFPDIMDEHYRNLTSGLLNEFEIFIQNVEISKAAFEYKVELDKSAYFLTFNYTNVLESLYNIERKDIVYIHNSAFYGSEQIVLGHGVDPANFEKKKINPPDNLNAEELERWNEEHDDYDYSYSTGKDNLMKYFKDMFKPTNEIIKKHNSFFKKLVSTNEIFIFGHSISSVDLPYFKEVIKSVNHDAKWNISYYNTEERNKHLTTLKGLGLKEENITLFKLEDIQENNKQLKIDL